MFARCLLDHVNGVLVASWRRGQERNRPISLKF